jgi:hypothetical protein
MAMHRVRVYVDASVFGGVHDEEFAEPSRRFFDLVGQNRFVVLVSDVTVNELRVAPKQVQAVLKSLDEDCMEWIEMDDEVVSLAEAYVQAGVVGVKSRNDAAQVAAATVAGAELILSWNFRHLVNIARISQFNSVNLANGYRPIDIRSPLEVYDE